MGFYLRKSIKVGPIRFNLSKSGVGVSGGVTGFRVGTGPRGNYVHMGRGGIYYRKTLPSGRSRARGDGVVPDFDHSPGGGQGPPVIMEGIESGDVSQMSDSSSAELLRELDEKKKIIRLGPIVVILSSLVVLAMIMFKLLPVLTFVVAGSLGALTYASFRRDILVKTVVLFYDFDPQVESAYDALHSAASTLADCVGTWHISASGKVHDSKYHAGASDLVSRSDTRIRKAAPPFLKTNIETVAIDVGGQTLYLFPDCIFVYDKGRVGAVGYAQLRLDVSQQRFIENGRLPGDAKVVDYTWRYVNKSGGPDRRFANNAQLPICLYDELLFSSGTGLKELIQVSRSGVGEYLERAIQGLVSATANLSG